jgi:hypothetical protein
VAYQGQNELYVYSGQASEKNPDTAMYSYAWTIRICGRPPNTWQAFDFSEQNVWRWEGASDSPTNKHALGRYYASSWYWGYMYDDGEFALTYQNYCGTQCANSNDYGASVIYLKCDYTRTKEDPYIEAFVASTCKTWMIVAFSEMCSVFHPAPSPTPTRIPAPPTTTYEPTPLPTLVPTPAPTNPIPTFSPTLSPTAAAAEVCLD